MKLACAVLFSLGCAALAQNAAVFRTRLSPVAMDATMRTTVQGDGSASGRLAGTKLTITGSFEGLVSPATIAQVHRSPVTAMRGPAIFDLTVTKGTSGSISGSFDLTPAQAEDLRKGRLYIQLHSEKAPDGNLWGWLLAASPGKNGQSR